MMSQLSGLLAGIAADTRATVFELTSEVRQTDWGNSLFRGHAPPFQFRPGYLANRVPGRQWS